MNTKHALEEVYKTMKEADTYIHAAGILSYDQETICPPAAMEEQGEIASLLYNKAFTLRRDPSFISNMEYLYFHRNELDEFDAANVSSFHREYIKDKNITPEMQLRFSNIFNKGHVAWLHAKQNSDYSIFLPALEKIRQVEMERYRLCDEKFATPYDFLFDSFESGVTSADLDHAFGRFKDRIFPLFDSIRNSGKKIRTDFLSRPVPVHIQEKLSKKLMDILGLDPERRALTVSEHPFTDGYSINDVRITTHYYEDAFASNMYSVIHEGGHALFEMFQPAANHKHYLNSKTMGQHESVSRFYENIIGRSEAFVHLIYPVLRELMPDTMSDVTERELYEALNVVQPSLVRTEADEFTYTFHVIIRYEIEKEMVNGDLDLKRLPEIWNEKYREYLGVVPENDRDGVLQDMHWSSGFGYFPTYALGNMYNAMYYNRMQQDFDVMQAVSSGDMARILDWMKANVFAKADRMDPKPWIHEITGRDFTPDDFLDYLEKKYVDLYGLD